MKNLKTIISILLNTAQISISALEFETNEVGRKIYWRDSNSLHKAKSALEALSMASCREEVELNEICISAKLLLLSLSNLAFAELDGDLDEFETLFKSKVMGTSCIERYIPNFLSAHKNSLNHGYGHFDYEDVIDLIIENVKLIDEFVKKDIHTEYSEDYVGGEMSLADVIFETMSFVLEIVVASHYDLLKSDSSLDNEEREILILLNMEKEFTTLAPLTILTNNMLKQEMEYYKGLMENKNRLVNRIAKQKHFEMSCLV